MASYGFWDAASAGNRGAIYGPMRLRGGRVFDARRGRRTPRARLWVSRHHRNETVVVVAMSALPSEADIWAGVRDICFVP
jgi:hypothetical protein